eukprot:Clim_evm17s238 gene=Clim_evmTU17s238
MATVRSALSTLQRLFNIRAAQAWDNVGVLLEPTAADSIPLKNVFLTIDLTERTLKEALDKDCNVIIAYHPPLFASFKRLTQTTAKERMAISCIENKVAVISPHTILDTDGDSITDWLARSCTMDGKNGLASLEPIEPIPADQIEDGPENTKRFGLRKGSGMGRIATLSKPTPIADIIQSLKTNLGVPHCHVAYPHKTSLFPEKKNVQSLAFCCGSGGSVVKGCDVDVYVTGEMGHHDVLEATARGVHVLLFNHTNTERGYLKFLAAEVQEEIKSTVIISETDVDPLETI